MATGLGLPGGPVAGARGSLPDAHRLQRRPDAAGFDHGGAAGYVLKQIRGSDLVGAVRVVASGQSLLDPHAAGKVMARLRDEADRRDRLARLTARERQVLELIGDGLTNRQIGERLSVAEKTVKHYVSVLFVKLGMEQRTRAAAYAARAFEPGWVPPRPRGQRCSHGRRRSVRPPLAVPPRPGPAPRCSSHLPGLWVTRHQRGFTHVRPSGLPLACAPGWSGNASASSLSFAPRSYPRRTSGRGLALNTG